MFSRSMFSVVITETVAGTSSSGLRLRMAAVVTASSWVGTAWGAGGACVGSAVAGAVGACAQAGKLSGALIAVVAISA